MFGNLLGLVGIILVSVVSIKYMVECKRLKFDNVILNKQLNEIKNNFEIYKKVSDCENGEVERLKTRNAELLLENMQLKSIVGAYRNSLGNGFRSTYSAQKIPQGAIEAVKYAMKKSHPDNGGNAEDFMRFQKVYEELTRKGGI